MTIFGIRQFLQEMAEVASLMTANSLAAARDLCEEHPFDLFLLDLNLPDGSGIDLIPTLKSHHPAAAIIGMSGNMNPSVVSQLRKLGVNGMYDKGDAGHELTGLIKQVLSGKQDVFSSTAQLLAAKSETFKLSARQQEVLLFIDQGLTNKEISYRLGLSQATIAFHVSELKKKLGCETTREIPLAAKQLGILS